MYKQNIRDIVEEKKGIEASIREHLEQLDLLPRLNNGMYSEEIKNTAFYKHHRAELNKHFKQLKAMLDGLTQKDKEAVQLYQQSYSYRYNVKQ